MTIISKSELASQLRVEREQVCFPVVNRGRLWYEMLDKNQLSELKTWYKAWLDAPETLIVPAAPDWLNEKLQTKMEVL